MDPMVIAFGFGVGILIGLTGIGGGSLMTPLLVLFAGVPPVVAIGTDLAYGAVTKTPADLSRGRGQPGPTLGTNGPDQHDRYLRRASPAG